MTKEIKILCVDDEPNVLNAIQRLFLDEEYELLTALSAEEGLTRLAQEKVVQVVVSDYRMPGMDGVEFLKQVYLRWPQTIRLVLSGYADIAAIVSAINEGQIYKFIPKPWNDDELRLAIAQAVDIYTLRQEHLELVEKLTRQSALHDRLIEEKREELAARGTALRRVQEVLDALPGAVLVVEGGTVIRECNQSGRELLGLAAQPLLPGPALELLPPQLLAAIAAVQGVGRPQTLELQGRELELRGRPLPGASGQWVFELWGNV